MATSAVSAPIPDGFRVRLANSNAEARSMLCVSRCRMQSFRKMRGKHDIFSITSHPLLPAEEMGGRAHHLLREGSEWADAAENSRKAACCRGLRAGPSALRFPLNVGFPTGLCSTTAGWFTDFARWSTHLSGWSWLGTRDQARVWLSKTGKLGGRREGFLHPRLHFVACLRCSTVAVDNRRRV